MLVTLKHPLETGQTVKATLKFDKAGTVDVDYPVVAIGAPAPGAAAGGGSMKMQDHGGGMMPPSRHPHRPRRNGTCPWVIDALGGSQTLLVDKILFGSVNTCGGSPWVRRAFPSPARGRRFNPYSARH